MGRRSIVSPRLTGQLVAAGHYPQTVTIQGVTLTRDALGEPIETWANVTGLTSLSAAIAPAGGSEPDTGAGEWAITSAKILLPAAYPTISVGQRAVDDLGRTWDIQAVEIGPFGEWTNLSVQIIQVGSGA